MSFQRDFYELLRFSNGQYYSCETLVINVELCQCADSATHILSSFGNQKVFCQKCGRVYRIIDGKLTYVRTLTPAVLGSARQQFNLARESINSKYRDRLFCIG